MKFIESKQSLQNSPNCTSSVCEFNFRKIEIEFFLAFNQINIHWKEFWYLKDRQTELVESKANKIKIQVEREQGNAKNNIFSLLVGVAKMTSHFSFTIDFKESSGLK
jgi:hypothetical protein